MRFTPFIPALLAFTSALSVAAPRDIYDSDHNGLIEIEDLQDLNEIRNNTSDEHPSEIHGTQVKFTAPICTAPMVVARPAAVMATS